MITTRVLTVGILVQGARARRVRVRGYWRVFNGKKVFVKAHWRYYQR